MAKLQQVFCIAWLLLFGTEAAWSQWSSELSADLPDSLTMATQEKVAKLYDAGEFERAFFIYRNELAPIGDKYAQYMVGYMYLTGMGVEEDRVEASAWYRLAAERGTAEFVAVRDQLLRSLDDDERSQSDAQYYKLREDYCDLAVLMHSVKRNLNEVDSTTTGSRIQTSNNFVTVIETHGGRARAGSDYYSTLRAQLEDRLKLMQEIGQFEDMETDPEKVDLRALERKVKEHIASLK